MSETRSVFSALTPTNRRILLGNGISALGSGLTFSFLVIYLGQVRGLGTTFAGLVVAFEAILGLAVTVPVGALVDRFGPRPVLLVGLTIEAIGTAALTLVTSVASALVVATILSIGHAAFWAPQSALYARVTPRERRQDLFGLQFMLLNLGLGLGGLIAATIVDPARPGTFVVLYLLDAATYLVYIAILIGMRGVGTGPSQPDDGDEASSGGYRVVLRDRAMIWLAIAAMVLLTVGYGSLDVGLPTYATVEGGLPPSAIAIAFAVNTAAVVLVQRVTLRVIRGRSRSRLMALVALLWAVTWGIIGISISLPPVGAVALMCVAGAIFAVGESIWSPSVHAVVNELAPDALRGRYNAIMGWTWSASGALGPAFAGIMLGSGRGAAWIIVVVLGCLVAGLLMLRLHALLTPRQDGRG